MPTITPSYCNPFFPGCKEKFFNFSDFFQKYTDRSDKTTGHSACRRPDCAVYPGKRYSDGVFPCQIPHRNPRKIPGPDIPGADSEGAEQPNGEDLQRYEDLIKKRKMPSRRAEQGRSCAQKEPCSDTKEKPGECQRWCGHRKKPRFCFGSSYRIPEMFPWITTAPSSSERHLSRRSLP